MKQLSRQQFLQVENWILRHARPLDAARYAILFQNGSTGDFLSLLAQYQNPDGGFGRALEPDNWNPASTPNTTCMAVLAMRSIGFEDAGHPIVQGILRYLRGCPLDGDGCFPFTLPSNNGYPHAPWWTHSAQINARHNLGFSAELAAFILHTCSAGDPLYQRALVICQLALQALMDKQPIGECSLSGYASLLPHWANQKHPWSLAEITAQFRDTCNASIVRDKARWEGYVIHPSLVIHSPASMLYPGNEAIVKEELDWLVDSLPPDGIWPLGATWLENDQVYPQELAVSQLWWKSVQATEKLLFLRAFNRLSPS